MYLDHFGLQQAPFRITPHTEFFFGGAKRGATLEALIYAITHDEGIVRVTGEVGSGKTMLCRMLLEKLPENVETVYLANPMLSCDEILLAIAGELGISLGEGRSHQLLQSLHERLLGIYAAGRQVVVLIDEAHAMPAAALEQIRLLSNLESSRHKLLQIVLFGQPELDQRLAEPSMRQLGDRITHGFRLDPLGRDDVASYLDFRLRAAGYRGPDLFTRAAIGLISRASGGLTRRINILADKALLAAFSAGVHQVGSRQVRAAIRDARFAPVGRDWRRPAKWVGAGALLLGVAGLAFFAGSRFAAPRLDGPAAPAGDPAALAPGLQDRAAGVAAAALLASEPSAAAEPPKEKPLAVVDQSEPATPPGPPRTAAVLQAKAMSVDDRLAATERWLKTTPDSHHFIQLLVTDATGTREVSDFIARHARVLDPAQIRVYRSTAGGRARLGVIYGDYATRAEASAALAALGEISPASRPYVRAVARLRPADPPAALDAAVAPSGAVATQ
ncbi:ExeA family protein [Accumulibacter sp.]|uniref:ExeA family protein n=1 Tax=Accumulibacter sp. TaxID=2053492 RepID=UPI0025D20A22|nr:AAA family ATPase [Accumulibacter sp.]MCM8594713.1 AAA family ATPase [Accumulibacter sp.]MCM8625871.1 AAA family ATPase [Accumulibacter sp.]MDS4048859.1 AAA family ATPase [Accumulibacter sp.]